MREALASREPAALTQAIHGLGGVGKTALAVEYAYRYAPEYNIIWWVRSEEAATLASEYAGLAHHLADIPSEVKTSSDQSAVVSAVRAWLRQHPGWLLVFDNVREPEEIRDYLPQGSNGHILITSRNPGWGKMARPLQVHVLPREKSMEFLLKRTGQKDEAAAKTLARSWETCPWLWSRPEPIWKRPARLWLIISSFSRNADVTSGEKKKSPMITMPPLI